MLKSMIRGVLPLMASLLSSGVSAMPDYSWKNRVLILFSEQDDPKLEQQKQQILASEPDLKSRDMVVFVVSRNGIQPIYGLAPESSEASLIRQRYKVGESTQFTAILIGRDGKIKWREKRPATSSELFALIDTMPMRRNEVSK